jgi:hypothetical protein
VKIWKTTEHDSAMAFYFFPTKAAAEASAREYRAAQVGEEYPGTVEVSSFDVEPTRAGIAEAMNWLITFTCFNER